MGGEIRLIHREYAGELGSVRHVISVQYVIKYLVNTYCFVWQYVLLWDYLTYVGFTGTTLPLLISTNYAQNLQ